MSTVEGTFECQKSRHPAQICFAMEVELVEDLLDDASRSRNPNTLLHALHRGVSAAYKLIREAPSGSLNSLHRKNISFLLDIAALTIDFANKHPFGNHSHDHLRPILGDLDAGLNWSSEMLNLDGEEWNLESTWVTGEAMESRFIRLEKLRERAAIE